MIELLVMLAILVLLISIAIPGLAFLKRHAINSELDKLQIICKLLQKQAVNTKRKEYLTFNSTEQSFFYCNHTEKLTTGVFFGFAKGIKGPPANPKEIITSAVTFPKNRITFHPNGTISAGTIYLTTQDQKTFYALTVPVSQVSFVRKYKCQNGYWLYIK